MRSCTADCKHEVVLFTSLTPELDFTFDRPTRFVDLEGAGSIITEPTVIREELARLNEPPVNPARLSGIASPVSPRSHGQSIGRAIDDFSAGRIGGKAA